MAKTADIIKKLESEILSLDRMQNLCGKDAVNWLRCELLKEELKKLLKRARAKAAQNRRYERNERNLTAPIYECKGA